MKASRPSGRHVPYAVFVVWLGLSWLVSELADRLGPFALGAVLGGVTLGPALVFVAITVRRERRVNAVLEARWEASGQADVAPPADSRGAA